MICKLFKIIDFVIIEVNEFFLFETVKVTTITTIIVTKRFESPQLRLPQE